MRKYGEVLYADPAPADIYQESCLHFIYFAIGFAWIPQAFVFPVNTFSLFRYGQTVVKIMHSPEVACRTVKDGER
ncbi:hypothetical protein [Prochlorococcus sp. MIT 0603]|uniref:hypothetical protein n=1 Tax=unclassified Prochlorococcus TaxID=2627481 RepID=UPI0005617F44|nr:hypothetical protein [Prochlorococcus sp. MIT 0603]